MKNHRFKGVVSVFLSLVAIAACAGLAGAKLVRAAKAT